AEDHGPLPRRLLQRVGIEARLLRAFRGVLGCPLGLYDRERPSVGAIEDVVGAAVSRSQCDLLANRLGVRPVGTDIPASVAKHLVDQPAPRRELIKLQRRRRDLLALGPQPLELRGGLFCNLLRGSPLPPLLLESSQDRVVLRLGETELL